MVTDKCTCGHLKDKHSLGSGGFRCDAKRCKCYQFQSIADDNGLGKEETEYQKRLRQGRRLNIALKENEISSREELDEQYIKTDKIRIENDIRSKKNLTWYQKTQRSNIVEQIKNDHGKETFQVDDTERNGCPNCYHSFWDHKYDGVNFSCKKEGCVCSKKLKKLETLK